MEAVGTSDDAAAPCLGHRIDPERGLVVSLDAGGGRECLSGPLLEPLVVKDEGDSWGAECWSYREVLGKFQLESFRLLASGSVRSISESVFTYGRSRIALRTLAYRGWPLLEFRFRIEWNERRCRLKLAVPTVFADCAARCEVPGGALDRPTDGEEHVHGRWLLLRGRLDGKDAALGIVNGGQHGFDLYRGEVRLSVLRSAAYCHERTFPLADFPERKYMDQGTHDVRILVAAGDLGAVEAMLPGLADWLDAPPAAYSHLPAALPAVGAAPGFLSLRPATVRLVALKRSEDGAALVVRLHETLGVETAAELSLAVPEVRAKLRFRPFELKTLRFEREGTWREVPLISEK